MILARLQPDPRDGKAGKKVAAAQNIALPEAGQYAVGMVFSSPDAGVRAASARLFEKIVAEEAQQVLGWRDLPTENSSLGHPAKAREPFLRQAFLQRGARVRPARSHPRSRRFPTEASRGLLRSSSGRR